MFEKIEITFAVSRFHELFLLPGVKKYIFLLTTGWYFSLTADFLTGWVNI